MNALTRLQREFLAKFFRRPSGQAFYLTGGVALSEYYLHHRLSQDLDLFTQSRAAFETSGDDLIAAAHEVGADVVRFHPPEPGDDLGRCFLKLSDEPELKIDIVRDAPPHFGEVLLHADGVQVDSLENLSVGKLLAVFGRAYPRDFVDLYFLLKSGVDFDQLLILAGQKDIGFSEYFLGGMMEQIVKVEERDLPKMLKPVDLEDMKRTLLSLAEQLKRVKPE
jgi:predicted nucleotidyltransferase component of viral defense system